MLVAYDSEKYKKEILDSARQFAEDHKDSPNVHAQYAAWLFEEILRLLKEGK